MGGGGEHSLKMSAPQLSQFGIDSVLNSKDHLLKESIIDKGVYRTAPATPGLLIREIKIYFELYISMADTITADKHLKPGP